MGTNTRDIRHKKDLAIGVLRKIKPNSPWYGNIIENDDEYDAVQYGIEVLSRKRVNQKGE